MSLPRVGSIVRQDARNYVVTRHGCPHGSESGCHNGEHAITAFRLDAELEIQFPTMRECLNGARVSQVVDVTSHEAPPALRLAS